MDVLTRVLLLRYGYAKGPVMIVLYISTSVQLWLLFGVTYLSGCPVDGTQVRDYMYSYIDIEGFV